MIFSEFLYILYIKKQWNTQYTKERIMKKYKILAELSEKKSEKTALH